MAHITGRELKDPLNHVDKERLILAGDLKGSEFSRKEVFSIGLDKVLDRLLSSGKRVVFLHAVPELPFNARECVSWAPNRYVNRVPRPQCESMQSMIDEREREFMPVLQAVLRRHPEVIEIDPKPYLCDGKRCVGKDHGMLLYRDDDHLSLQGSRWLARRMEQSLNRVLEAQ